jgi:hypothetical protein
MTVVALDSTRNLNVVFAETAEIRDFRIAEELEVGDVVYVNSAGKAAKADANDTGKEQARGIVVKRQGNTVSVMKRGYLGGFDISGLAYDAQVFLSDTVGKLDTAAGTVPVPCGRVSVFTNDSLTKILYVEFDWITQFVEPEGEGE